MSNSQYPRDLHHPNGYRTVTVFDSDEERQVQREFAAFRRGETAPARSEVAQDDIPRRRGRAPRGLVGNPDAETAFDGENDHA